MLACSTALYAIGKLVFGRGAHAMQGKAAVTFTPTRLRGVRALLPLAPFVLVSLTALLPHLGVIFTSFSQPGSWYGSVLPQAFTTANYAEALGHDMTVLSIRNSLPAQGRNTPGHGVGLKAVSARIEEFSDGRGSVRTATDAEGFVAVVSLPMTPADTDLL